LNMYWRFIIILGTICGTIGSSGNQMCQDPKKNKDNMEKNTFLFRGQDPSNTGRRLFKSRFPVLCSGRGECVKANCEDFECNYFCECDKRSNPLENVYGQYCECDNFTCDRYNGVICGGHGQCECGRRCRCDDGWDVPGYTACECSSSLDNCMSPDGSICSGRGNCECGQCRCGEDEEGAYAGRFCEECPTCRGKCSPLFQCLEDDDGCLLEYQLTNTTQYTKCSFIDRNDCRVNFSYAERNNQFFVNKGAVECPVKNSWQSVGDWIMEAFFGFLNAQSQSG